MHRYLVETGDDLFLRSYWWAVEAIADWVAAHWALPDAGLWEFRGRRHHHTHSKLMCWVALRCGAEMAERPGLAGKAKEWREGAAAVADALWRQAYRPETGRFGQSFEGDEVDAALLLLPLYGFPPDDPAFVRTLEAIERELVEGPFVYRYREDDLGRAAHPFLLASCWLARVYLRQGRRAEAGEVLEGVSRVATGLGLFGEHVDQETGEPQGNFPHMFSHAGFLLAALEVAAASAAPGPGAGGA